MFREIRTRYWNIKKKVCTSLNVQIKLGKIEWTVQIVEIFSEISFLRKRTYQNEKSLHVVGRQFITSLSIV